MLHINLCYYKTMNSIISEKVKYLNNMLCEIDNLYQSLLLEKGLSDSEYVVLFSILELGEGCLQKDIATNSFINKKTINSTIKKLEKNGLIKLEAGKYPNMHIFLTDSGKKYIQKNVIPIIEIENNVMESVPDANFENLIKTYAKYIKIFKEEITELIKK